MHELMNYYLFQSLVQLSESSLKDSDIASMTCLNCGEKTHIVYFTESYTCSPNELTSDTSGATQKKDSKMLTTPGSAE